MSDSNVELLVLMTDRDAVGGYKRVRGQVTFDGAKVRAHTIRREQVPVWRQRLGAVLHELDELERAEVVPS